MNGIAGATGQEDCRETKKDGFRHTVILLNAKADSSCFGLNVLIFQRRDLTKLDAFVQRGNRLGCCANLKIVVAITGASGALYAQRLLDNLHSSAHEVHVVQSNYAQQVISEELPGGLILPNGAKLHNLKSMNAPFASGSNPADAMVVVPCTMGTMGRIAHGYSEDVLLRTADVMLKEKKKLILVPRETPLGLIHIRNMELLLLAGAVILPANPSFYSGAKTIVELVDTVVSRILDHVGIENNLAPRWAEEKE